jgi:formylglycine-generating enzyme required for sulfatase activity
MLAARLAVLAGGLVALAACAKVAGIDGLEIGECKGGLCVAEGGSDDAPLGAAEGGPPNAEGSAPFDGAGLPCPGDKGPVMLRVGTAESNFCIDTTEVTVGHYREFTVAKGTDVGGQPPECAWNTSYAAGTGGADDLPIGGVDWCDARAYCAWAGKRLCGKQQGDKFVGRVTVDDLGDFTTHEWLLACSNLGQLRYPYGGIQQPTACNTAEADAGRSLAVKTKAACQGGSPGLYDLIGNVWEWFDGPCLAPDAGGDAAGIDSGPAKQECIVKGGSFAAGGVNLDCRADGRGATRDRRGTDIGFRCCAD